MSKQNTAVDAETILTSLLTSTKYRFINNCFEFQYSDGSSKVWYAKDLALIDDRLPHTLQQDYIWLPKENNELFLRTKIIKDSLGYWKACNYLITDIEGYRRALASILEIKVEDNDLVYLSCEIYQSRVCIVELEDRSEYVFRYASGKRKTSITVVKSVLDAQYPQWLDNWAMLELLGIAPNDRVPFLFGYLETPSLPQIKLPDEITTTIYDQDQKV